MHECTWTLTSSYKIENIKRFFIKLVFLRVHVSVTVVLHTFSINPTIDFLLHNFVDHSENDDSMASNNEAQLKCTLLNV